MDNPDLEPSSAKRKTWGESPGTGDAKVQKSHWIFGYGSLMWNPGFPYQERRLGVLQGYRRTYAMFSTRLRGSTDRPGLVLSVVPGGACTGVAFRVAEEHWDDTLAKLDKREGTGRAHLRVWVPVRWLGNGDSCATPALTYLPLQSYPNYIPGLPLERQAELVARGKGSTGSSLEYLELLMKELRALGIQEPELEALHQASLSCRRD